MNGVEGTRRGFHGGRFRNRLLSDLGSHLGGRHGIGGRLDGDLLIDRLPCVPLLLDELRHPVAALAFPYRPRNDDPIDDETDDDHGGQHRDESRQVEPLLRQVFIRFDLAHLLDVDRLLVQIFFFGRFLGARILDGRPRLFLLGAETDDIHLHVALHELIEILPQLTLVHPLDPAAV